MRLFRWKDEHQVFAPPLDAEHRDLFRRGEELQRAIAAGAEISIIQEKVRLLAAAAENHFAHEERLMRSLNYSSYAWHKGLHDGVRRQLQAFAERLGGPEGAAGGAAAVRDLLRFLDAWLRDHIAVADRMMASYVRNAERAAQGLAADFAGARNRRRARPAQSLRPG